MPAAPSRTSGKAPPSPSELAELPGIDVTAPGSFASPGDRADVDSPGEERDKKPGLFDLVSKAQQIINGWFASLVGKALNPALRFLGRTLLATPDLPSHPEVRRLWAMSLGIVNVSFILLLTAGGLMVMGHESVQTRYTVKDLVPRVLLGWVGANASLSLAGLAIDVANAVTRVFTGADIHATGLFSTLLYIAVGLITGHNIFLILLGLVAAVLAVTLIVACLIRWATVAVLVIGAPICLACYALPSTSGLARLWWRALFGALGVQVAQAIVFVTGLRIFLVGNGNLLQLPAGGLMNAMLLISLLWLMVRIPALAGRAILSSGGSSLQTVKYAVMHRTVGAVAGPVGALASKVHP